MVAPLKIEEAQEFYEKFTRRTIAAINRHMDGLCTKSEGEMPDTFEFPDDQNSWENILEESITLDDFVRLGSALKGAYEQWQISFRFQSWSLVFIKYSVAQIVNEE